MTTPTSDLLSISTIAFSAVIVLLAVLAAIIRLITLAFPARETEADAAILAAVTSAYTTLYPGMRVTNIEEQR